MFRFARSVVALLFALVLVIRFADADGIATGIVVGEVIHIILAGVDLASDITLLLSLRDTVAQYESNKDRIETTVDATSYPFEYCMPDHVDALWLTNLSSRCDCNSFDVSCDAQAGVEQKFTIDGLVNSLVSNDNDSLVANESVVNGNLSASRMSMATAVISCVPHFWAQDESYQGVFTFLNWSCAQCDCNGHVYDRSSSVALAKTFFEYEALFAQQLQYCDPDALLTDDYSENIGGVLIVCWVFIIVGSLTQFIACCVRFIAVKGIDSTNEKEALAMKEDLAKMEAVRFAFGYFVSLLEDVPQTIVAMYYMQFLYADNGFYCHSEFADYPNLAKMEINSAIAFAVATSVIMIVFNGFRSGFKLQARISKVLLDDADDKKVVVLAVLMVLTGTILYVLSLLMPIAAVAYYEIGPNFHKDWTPAFIVFVAGCSSWGLICCVCAIVCCMVAHDN